MGIDAAGNVTLRVGPVYQYLYTCQEPWIVIEGPRGTGKSVAILMHLVTLCLTIPGIRVALIRRFRADLTKSLLPALEEEVFPMFGMTTPGGNLSRASRLEYKFDNGSRIVPIGIDTDGAGSLLSTAWTYAYVAEATEIDFEMLSKLDGCMRWIRTLSQPRLPENAQVYVDCNPTNPTHPLNKRAEPISNSARIVRTREDYERLQVFNRKAPSPGHWKRIVTKVQDNPGYWNFKAWAFTKAGYNYVVKRLSNLIGHLKARWVDGLWVAAEGAVFKEFTDANIVAPFETWRRDRWPVHIFVDPGEQHPMGVSWITVSPQQVKYTVAELKISGVGGVKNAKRLIEKKSHSMNIVQWWGDPRHVKSKTHQAPKSIIEQYREEGVRMREWPVTTGSAAKDAAVQTLRDEIVTGMWKVCEDCVETIGEYQSWQYKTNARGEMLTGDDQYEDENNDILDGQCGAAVANLKGHEPKGSFIGG